MGGADHLGPFLGFVGEELAELGWRERKRGATEIGKARLDLGIARAVAISPLSLSTIAAGVCLGAPTPSQSPAS